MLEDAALANLRWPELRNEAISPRGPSERKSTWAEFLRTHWGVMAATDFFTVEVWTLSGLVRYHVLFVIRLSTREVCIAGIIQEPNGGWMKQVARNLTDCIDGFLRDQRYLIHDRSTLFT